MPENQPLLQLVVPHFLNRNETPPPHPRPYRPYPASFHHGREGKQSWHRLFNEEQSSERGEEAPFSTHIKIQAAPTKGPGQAAQPQFHLTRSVLFFFLSLPPTPPPAPTSSQLLLSVGTLKVELMYSLGISQRPPLNLFAETSSQKRSCSFFLSIATEPELTVQ